MAVFLFYAAYRYLLKARLVKQDFPHHWVGKSSIWLLRTVGLALVARGFCFCLPCINLNSTQPLLPLGLPARSKVKVAVASSTGRLEQTAIS
jgi:hypothetical protein